MIRSALFQPPSSSDPNLIFRRLMELRLVVLGAVLGLMLLLLYAAIWDAYLPGAFMVVGCTIVWTVYLYFSPTPVAGIQDRHLVRELIVDGVWLTLLVIFTGGSANPFIYYFLVLIAIIATILSARWAWSFTLTSMVIYSLMLYWDFERHFDHMSRDYQFHLLGMWVNYVGSAGVTCLFISHLARILREYQLNLSAAREEKLKAEQMIGVATLAASTVHALGTPLSTLTILLGEMQHSDTKNQQDIALMLTQIERCKHTMQKLAMLAERDLQTDALSNTSTEPVVRLVDDIREHYAIALPRIKPRFVFAQPLADPLLPLSLLLRPALINLIDNALQAAKQHVQVHFNCTDQSLVVRIQDDGEGITDDLKRSWGKPVRSTKSYGLGIGVFLANSTIEKLGGHISLESVEDRKNNMSLNQVSVTLPLINNQSNHSRQSS